MGKKKTAEKTSVSATTATAPTPKTTSAPTSSSTPAPSKPLPEQRWLRQISRANLALLLLVYIFIVHLTGLIVFTRGFLLSRVSIPTTTPAYTSSPPIEPTHSKAVILIIDALRTDFISPHHPSPASPNHHGVLTLPAELSAKYPSKSLIFNTYSDPPTSTMQRIKGITTGSLPTFIDISSNFASTAIEEDSIISQVVAAGKKVVFMGDDTWSGLFPKSFAHSHPYDSFNVEDLHTVDNGVIEHLFPYLHADNSSKWDVLIGHFLGVDHVGHRVGPERDTMKAKLSQMDQVLRDVVDLLDDDTLLVVLGDHGMDPKGNHGGDSELEVAAALWMYSKGADIGGAIHPHHDSFPTYTYPGSSAPLRHANQIDLVPTLSMLLGLPVPFNNLGSVIPETCPDMATLELATRLNAEQVSTFVKAYGDESIPLSLRPYWSLAEVSKERLIEMYEAGETDGQALLLAQTQSARASRSYTLAALEKLRSLWAQFSVALITLGSVILGLSLTTLIALYQGVRNNGPNWDVFVRLALDTATLPSLASGALAFVVSLFVYGPLQALKSAVVGTVVISEIMLSLPLAYRLTQPLRPTFSLQHAIGPLMLVLHAVSFASNSFIMWEDRMVVYLLNTIFLVHLLKALLAPTATMRIKILGWSLAMMILVRLIGTITVCREEQQPYCTVTFYFGSTPTASKYALAGILLIGFHLPRAIGITLNASKSLAGPAHAILGLSWRGSLVLNAIYWILEWLESWDGIQPPLIPHIQLARIWLARASFGIILAILPYQWMTGSLCIKVERDPDQTGDQSAVTVFGFANAYGSTYILFLLIPFAAIHLVSQPMAQIALAGMLIILLAHLEVTDTHRDAIIMRQSFAGGSNPGAWEGAQSTAIARPSFTDVAPLLLLGYVGFFSTGHQAVLTTIQWKAAFVGFPTVTYPFSPLLVVLNTWGPFMLSAFALPLLALWNISPRPQSTIPVLTHTLQVCLAGMIYQTTTTLASAIFAAHLRRHLMVWKVFAPRFMLSGVTLLVFDLCVIVAVGVGMRVTAWKVWRTFKCEAV